MAGLGRAREQTSQRALQSLAISLAIQIVVSPLTILWLYPVRKQLDQHPWPVAVWLALAVLAVPVIGGSLVARLADEGFFPFKRGFAWLLRPTGPPTVWDWLFTANLPYESFLVIEFTDGHRIAGVFSEGSIALTSPEPHGMFLSREWSLDENGNLVDAIPGTAGVIIAGDANIRSIHILQGVDND